LRSSAVVRLLNFLTDQTIEGAKYDSLREPLLFKQLGAPYRNIYWRGAMDVDGSFKNQITFTSASERFVFDFKAFLDSLQMVCNVSQKPSGPFSLYLYAKDKLRFVQEIGSLNPKKSDDLLDFLQKKKTYTKYLGMKKDVLTEEGYFNFDLLDSLFIIGLGSFLETYRAGRSYAKMDQYFEMAHGSYTKMEKNARGLPYSMLKKIINESQLMNCSVYDLLQKNSDSVRFHVSNSVPQKLPLKPNNQLNEVLAFIEPKLSYVLLSKMNAYHKELFEEIFDLYLTDTQVKSRLLSHFFLTFYDFEENTPTLTIKEFYAYKKKWREEIFS
jgi:hypothetical protein